MLSVLDLAPVGQGSTPRAALGHSVELARLAERLGYRRLWVAEHHNMPGIASSSPPVLIAHLAASTTTLRVGAGGVMLPNHAPLVVAEQFGMLEALHPGRIDLGIGRAPGTDQVTAAALRRSPAGLRRRRLPRAAARPLRVLRRHAPAASPRCPAAATGPRSGCSGSSDYSAQRRGHARACRSRSPTTSRRTTPWPRSTCTASAFRPSAELDRPYAMIGVPVICADTAEHARWLAGPSALSFVRLRQGRPHAAPHARGGGRVRVHAGRARARAGWTAPLVVGDPDEVRAGLEALAARTGVDEMMITTMVHGHADRLRSYELVAEAFDLAPVAAP